MLKPVLIAVGGFLVLVAFMAENLSDDITVKGQNGPEAPAAQAKEKPEPKPFTSAPAGTGSAKAVDELDVEGTGADNPEDQGFSADGYDTDPFSTAPAYSFDSGEAETEPEPSLAENTVDQPLNPNDSVFGGAAVGTVERSTSQQSSKPKKAPPRDVKM